MTKAMAMKSAIRLGTERTATLCAGLMAIAFWWLRRDFDPAWWLPNLYLVAWPAWCLCSLLSEQQESTAES